MRNYYHILEKLTKLDYLEGLILFYVQCNYGLITQLESELLSEIECNKLWLEESKLKLDVKYSIIKIVEEQWKLRITLMVFL